MAAHKHETGFSTELRANNPDILWRADVLQVVDQDLPTRMERVRSVLTQRVLGSDTADTALEENWWDSEAPERYSLPIHLTWDGIRAFMLILGIVLTMYGLINFGLDLRKESTTRAEESTGPAVRPVEQASAFSFTVPARQVGKGKQDPPVQNQNDYSVDPPMATELIHQAIQEANARKGAIKEPAQEKPLDINIAPEEPVRLVIPAIGLDAPIVPAESGVVRLMGKDFELWQAPDQFAAGWHMDSARLGEPGNTVLNGHNNIYGEVFAHLEDLKPGDTIQVYGEDYVFQYRISNLMILPEKYETLDVRSTNAQWILSSNDERLTLVSCWPYNSNTHRLIVVASPISRAEITKLYR